MGGRPRENLPFASAIRIAGRGLHRTLFGESALSKATQEVLRSSEGAAGGWLDGGCLILADALADRLGQLAERFMIVDANGNPQHVVVSYGGRLLDADGASTERALLRRWSRVEHVADPGLVPLNVEAAVAAGIPQDADASSRLGELIAPHVESLRDAWGAQVNLSATAFHGIPFEVACRCDDFAASHRRCTGPCMGWCDQTCKTYRPVPLDRTSSAWEAVFAEATRVGWPEHFTCDLFRDWQLLTWGNAPSAFVWALRRLGTELLIPDDGIVAWQNLLARHHPEARWYVWRFGRLLEVTPDEASRTLASLNRSRARGLVTPVVGARAATTP